MAIETLKHQRTCSASLDLVEGLCKTLIECLNQQLGTAEAWTTHWVDWTHDRSAFPAIVTEAV